MKIYVLTNGIRNLHNSYQQINYELYVDVTNNPHKCYIDLLNMVKDIEDDILILEDDLILCNNFLDRINSIINQYGNYIINFFWQPLRNVKNTTIETRGFCYTQCVYYPKGIINRFYNDLKEPDFCYSKNIRLALEKNGLSFVNIRPHYVQHIGDNSLIWQNACVRRSKQFVDDNTNIDDEIIVEGE